MANEKIPYIMTESIVDLPAPVKKIACFFQNNDKKWNNFQKKVA